MEKSRPKTVQLKKEHAQARHFVDEKIVSQMTGAALPTLRKWRSERRGPSYIKIGRMVRYDINEIMRFMDAHRIELNGRQ